MSSCYLSIKKSHKLTDSNRRKSFLRRFLPKIVTDTKKATIIYWIRDNYYHYVIEHVIRMCPNQEYTS